MITFTRHARKRCEEMGLRSIIATEILRYRDTTYPGTRPDTYVALSRRHPEYRVIFASDAEGTRIITVAFENKEFEYVRNGETFAPKGAAS